MLFIVESFIGVFLLIWEIGMIQSVGSKSLWGGA